MDKLDTYTPVVTFIELRDSMEKMVNYKRNLLHDMIAQYRACENMETATDKLATWREIIDMERIELNAYEDYLDKLG